MRSWRDFAYSGCDHFRLAIWADTFTGRMLERGVPGRVNMNRATSTLWHIISLSTPPPCNSPCQNHGMCGPLCSSAARARYGRPVSAAPRAQISSRPRMMSGANSWFSRYPVFNPTLCARAATFFASATFRARGFSQARPRSVPAPLFMAPTISSMFEMRAWLGPHSQSAFIAGSATMSRMDLYGLASPTSCSRASAAVAAAFFSLGLQTPRTSASRTDVHDWMCKRALKPLPMNPSPRRSLLISFSTWVLRHTARSRSQAKVLWVELGVSDAELRQRFRRTAIPIRIECVADIAKVFHSNAAGPEAGRSEIAESIEEGDAIGHRGWCARGPRNVVQDLLTLSDTHVGKGLSESGRRLRVDPSEAGAHPLLVAWAVRHDEVHELGHAGIRCASGALVARNDHVAEDAHGPEFRRCE